MPKDNLDITDKVLPQGHRVRHVSAPPPSHIQRIHEELRKHGAVTYNMWLPETKHLAKLIHSDEHVMGSVFGRYSKGRGALVATDKRVLFIDKKLLFTHVDEMTFAIIGGVTYSRLGLFGHVIVHTRLGDYDVTTMNHNNALNFVEYIEAQCVKEDDYQRGVGFNSMPM